MYNKKIYEVMEGEWWWFRKLPPEEEIEEYEREIKSFWMNAFQKGYGFNPKLFIKPISKRHSS